MNIRNVQNGSGAGGSGPLNCSDSAVDRMTLLRKIQELSFAKTETELYLDAHPDAAAALEYYLGLIKQLRGVTEEYEAKYGPITAAGSRNGWSWVEGKWPWQYEAEEVL